MYNFCQDCMAIFAYWRQSNQRNCNFFQKKKNHFFLIFLFTWRKWRRGSLQWIMLSRLSRGRKSVVFLTRLWILCSLFRSSSKRFICPALPQVCDRELFSSHFHSSIRKKSIDDASYNSASCRVAAVFVASKTFNRGWILYENIDNSEKQSFGTIISIIPFLHFTLPFGMMTFISLLSFSLCSNNLINLI